MHGNCYREVSTPSGGNGYVLAFSNYLPVVAPSGIGVKMATFIVVGDPPRTRISATGSGFVSGFWGLPASWRLREFLVSQKTKGSSGKLVPKRVFGLSIIQNSLCASIFYENICFYFSRQGAGVQRLL